MASTVEYAKLADAVYGGPGSPAPPGWSKLTPDGVDAETENGYYGAAYRNNATGEIVIASRGTRGISSLNDLQADAGIGTQGLFGIPEAFKDAEAFAREVVANYPDANIAFVGHSLGGAEAQFQAGQLDFGKRAFTFAAPGAAFALSADQLALAAPYVINYALPGEPIANFGEVVGHRVIITPTALTRLKQQIVVLGGAFVGGLPGLLLFVVGMIGIEHGIGNYIDALEAAIGAGAGKPQARITDLHVCPMVTGLVSHVGGPIVLGCPTVIVGGQPAARITDLATCVGPPDVIVLGSSTVIIGGQPSARLGDLTAHGGVITTGMPQVLVGG